MKLKPVFRNPTSQPLGPIQRDVPYYYIFQVSIEYGFSFKEPSPTPMNNPPYCGIVSFT